MVKFEGSPPKCPKSMIVADPTLNLGYLRTEERGGDLPPLAFDPGSKLDVALDRLLQGIRRSRGSGEGGAK